MSKLLQRAMYTIPERLRALDDHLDDVGGVLDEEVEAELDRLLEARDEYLPQAVAWLRNAEAEAAAINEHYKRVSAANAAANKKIESVKKGILRLMRDASKWNEGGLTISISEGPEAVEMGDTSPLDLPPDLQATKIEADKAAIKEALKAGRVIEGVSLVRRPVLRIKGEV